jgi:hypothetical protein
LRLSSKLRFSSTSDSRVRLAFHSSTCFAGDSVSFLDSSDQLLGLSVDNIEIVVRQFAPALTDPFICFHLPFSWSEFILSSPYRFIVEIQLHSFRNHLNGIRDAGGFRRRRHRIRGLDR